MAVGVGFEDLEGLAEGTQGLGPIQKALVAAGPAGVHLAGR